MRVTFKKENCIEMNETVYHAYLRRKHAIVPWAREILTTGSFNVGSITSDSDNLDERNLDGDRRRDEDGIHRIIRHLLANRRIVHNHCDVMNSEVS